MTTKNKKPTIHPAVREYLSANGRKGGEATRDLYQSGKSKKKK